MTRIEEVYAACAKAASDEPELPDEMPNEMWECMRASRDYATEAMRIAVRQTKRGIIERIRALTAASKEAAAPEFGWLLESPSIGRPPDYYAGRHWSPDANDAIRFARRADAEHFLTANHRPADGVFLHGGEIFVREHGWAAAPRDSQNEGETPDAYLVEFYEDTVSSRKHCTIASLEPREPTILLPDDKGIKSRKLIKTTPLYARSLERRLREER